MGRLTSAQSDSSDISASRANAYWNQVRTAPRELIKVTPFASDAVRYYHTFSHQFASCRGVYHTYSEASSAGAKTGRVRYNDGLFPGPEIIGEAAHMRRRDYPIICWLAPHLREGIQILNLGGSAGSEYFTYRQFLHFPPGLRWLVWELPHTVKFGEHLTRTQEAPGLAFTTRLEDGEGSDVVLTCGAMQYFEQDLASCLMRLRKRPRRIFINRVPLYEGETFFTLQNVMNAVVPYRIQNRQEFVDSLIDLNYHLVDCWYENHEIVIPFHPERMTKRFYGLYFVSNEAAEPDWRTSAIAAALQVRGCISRVGAGRM
jgi:putative methyltransferase (TIGR04325 family)